MSALLGIHATHNHSLLPERLHKRSRLPYKLAQLAQTGLMNSPWCCWEYVPIGEFILVVHMPNVFTVKHFAYQENSLQPGTRHTFSEPSAEDHALNTTSCTTFPRGANLLHTLQSGLSKYVYVRRDSCKNPLQGPYDGRYLIINQSDKYFTLNIKGREDIVSIDHLKTAFNTDLTGCKNNNLVTSAESSDLSDNPTTEILPALRQTTTTAPAQTETSSSAQTDDNYSSSSATRVGRTPRLLIRFRL